MLMCIYRIAEIAATFHRVLDQGSGSRAKGDLSAAMRPEGIQYYADCDLLYYANKAAEDRPEAYYLVLNGKREPAKNFR